MSQLAPSFATSPRRRVAASVRSLCAFVPLCLCAFLPLPAYAQSWAQRATQLKSKEISPEQARSSNASEDQDRRNKICIRGIRPAMPGIDWNADPTALPYVLYQFNKRTGLPVHVETGGLDVATSELFENTLVYLTSHTRWGFNEKETENVARFLARGGTLFLDDCYNRGSAFSDCVRPEVTKMIPGAEPIMLLASDPRVTDAFKLTYKTPWPGEANFENRPWHYYLLDGRPAVFFTPNDDGCAWEVSTPPTASNPIGEGIGHGGDNRQREVMYQWAANFFLYVFTH